MNRANERTNDREAIPAENRLVWVSSSCLCRTTCLRHAYKFISMCNWHKNTRPHSQMQRNNLNRHILHSSCIQKLPPVHVMCVCAQHTIFFSNQQSSSKAQAANVLLWGSPKSYRLFSYFFWFNQFHLICIIAKEMQCTMQFICLN